MTQKCWDSCSGKHIGVIGAGVSGAAIAELAKKLSARVFVSDFGAIKADTAERFKKLGIDYEEGGHTDRLYEADFIVLGSGISPASEPVRRVKEKGIPLCGELDFVAPHLCAPVIGVTGSNGKTTTTSLVAHILKSCGYAAVAAGNIGTPLASCANDSSIEWIAAELSSFQLHWSSDFQPRISIVTNLAPDHIDWHGSYEAYVEAKAKIISLMNGTGCAIYQASDEKYLPVPNMGYPLSWQQGKGIVLRKEEKRAVLYDHKAELHLFSFEDTDLMGMHNMENVAMAMTAAHCAGCRMDKSRTALRGFTPPPHRCQFVCEVKGIKFVDDSKGTNVAATITAITSLPGDKVILLGGKGKGEDYRPLADAVKENVRFAVLFGSEREAIAKALEAVGYENLIITDSMEAAVKEAYSRALPGDTVLLSPACTSWDSYSNYKERGIHFSSIARSIE